MASRNLEALQRLVAVQKAEGSLEQRTTADFEKAMDQLWDPDVEVHEPPSLGMGGVHKGRDAWYDVRRRELERRLASPWDQTIELLHMWDVPEDDVVILHHMMEYTDSRTGRRIRQPALELLTFKDAKIVRTQLFPHDTVGLLDTLT